MSGDTRALDELLWDVTYYVCCLVSFGYVGVCLLFVVHACRDASMIIATIIPYGTLKIEIYTWTL
jgi:hypothetical protein